MVSQWLSTFVIWMNNGLSVLDDWMVSDGISLLSVVVCLMVVAVVCGNLISKAGY